MKKPIQRLLIPLLAGLLFSCGGDDDKSDILPDCEVDGRACRNDLECFSNDRELQCGYCTLECSGGAACPVGTQCAGNGLCLIKCGESGDCPRGYQICDEGVCVSPADDEVSCD